MTSAATSAGYWNRKPWEDAPAPALVAKRLAEAVLGHEVLPRYARFLNNATHWGFGLAALADGAENQCEKPPRTARTSLTGS